MGGAGRQPFLPFWQINITEWGGLTASLWYICIRLIFLLDIFEKSHIIKIEYTKYYMKKEKVKIIIGVIVGGILGYLLYRFVGCKTGTCIITSKPWSSILYGMLLGLLVGLKL